MAYNSIYNNVYNYYHSTYAPKSSSRADAHKKSELKNIYNNIVKQSKDESVYLFKPTSDIEKYTISMKESAMKFQQDISYMGGQDANELFEKKAIYSSSPEHAEVSELPGSLINDESTLELTIESLAKPQSNNGYYLPSDELGLVPASYSFDVATPSSSYELQLNVSENDTNLSVQTRLARLINNAAIGLSASVSQDIDGKSSLSISSQSTGNEDEPPFNISDEETSQSRGLIDFLGIKDPSVKASWAKYTINGESKTSPDNEIIANNKYQIRLKKVTSPDAEPIKIGTMADYDSLKENILGLAESYNQFIKTASEFLDKQPRTSVLIENMKRMNNNYAAAMNRLGIKRNDDATLAIDEAALSGALNTSATAEDISSLKDFTKSASKKIADIQLNPMNYVDKRLVAYKNPHHKYFANPYITSAYSGMMFNSYM